MAHAQKPDFVFRRNRRVHLNRRGRQFSRQLVAEVCPSALVMLDAPRSEVVWRVLATHSIRQFPIHFPSHASPCAIRFQTHSTTTLPYNVTVSCCMQLIETGTHNLTCSTRKWRWRTSAHDLYARTTVFEDIHLSKTHLILICIGCTFLHDECKLVCTFYSHLGAVIT